MSQAVVPEVSTCCKDPLLCAKCGYCIRYWPLHKDGYAGALYSALGTVQYLSSGFHFENHKAVGALLDVAHLALEQVFTLTSTML